MTPSLKSRKFRQPELPPSAIVVVHARERVPVGVNAVLALRVSAALVAGK